MAEIKVESLNPALNTNEELNGCDTTDNLKGRNYSSITHPFNACLLDHYLLL